MIDIKAFIGEDGTAIKIKELTGSIDKIIDETAAIVATIVMSIYQQGGPEDIRPKEYEAFIMQEMIKRIKKAVKQIQTGETELKERSKKKPILTKQDGTNKGYLN